MRFILDADGFYRERVRSKLSCTLERFYRVLDKFPKICDDADRSDQTSYIAPHLLRAADTGKIKTVHVLYDALRGLRNRVLACFREYDEFVAGRAADGGVSQMFPDIGFDHPITGDDHSIPDIETELVVHPLKMADVEPKH